MSDIKITDLFNYSNVMADWIKTNPAAYQAYLNTAARTEHFTVANKLLIQGYMQNVQPKYLADENDYLMAGYNVNPDAAIYVMKNAPEKKYGYEVRKMYDISATNAEYDEPVLDKGFVLDALLLNSPCQIEYTDSLPTKALYNPDKGIIQMTKGFKSFEEIFFTIAQEYTHCLIHQRLQAVENGKNGNTQIKIKYTRGSNMFSAFSVAYTLSERFNMRPANCSIKSLPESWQYLECMDFKKELSSIDTVLNEISAKVNEKLQILYRGDEASVS